MKKAIAMRWVEALRSKKYKQGQGQLRSGDKFCCLGVLCNLHAEANPNFAATQTDPEYYGDEIGYAPVIVQKWAGLKFDNGDFGGGNSLVGFNDDDGANFFEIADIIEKNWRKL